MNPELYPRLYAWLASRRRSVLAAMALVGAVCAILSLRINLEEDLLSTLPRNDRIVDEYKYTVRKFHEIDRVYIDVGASNGSEDALSRAADEYYARLSTNTALARITYHIEFGNQRTITDFLTGALPNLFTAADEPALTARLATNALRAFLVDRRRKLAGPEGMVLKDVVASDPIGMSGLVIAKILPLQTGFGEARVEDGRLMSGDGHHVLMLAEPRFPPANSPESRNLVADLESAARDVEREFPGIRVAITGGHRMTVDNARLIQSDATRCLTLAMGAMLVLCLTAYRRRWLALLTFLPSFVGTLMAGAMLALLWRHVSAIATGFTTIAIGITVDYAIYVIYHLDNAAGLERSAVGRHLGRLVLPITAGALTTIAGFLVMASSPLAGYQQVAVFGSLGVLFSAAFAMIILPLLVPLPKQRGQPPLWLTRRLEDFHAWRKRRMVWLVPGMAVLTAVSIAGIGKLHFAGDLARFNGITEATRRDEALIRGVWGDALGMTLVVARGTNAESALERNDRAAQVLARDPAVKAAYSLSAICPSRATQEENLRRWREFWTPARLDVLRGELRQIGGELGFREDAFAPFWAHITNAPVFLTLEMFRGTALEEAVRERVAEAPGDVAVSTLLKVEDRSQIDGLRRDLPGLIVLDGQALAGHIADLAKKDLRRFGAWTALLVAAVVYACVGSIELVAATLLPLGIGLLWTFGAMGWLGLPIDLMNSVFVIFIISIGEDYSVFLMSCKLDEWRGHPRRIGATSASVLISALTTIFGFAVLVFARHPVLFSLGTTVLLGMACGFAATLLLTPLFMDLLLFHAPPRGAPRWWHPLGALWVAVHLGGSQLFLYYALRPVLKLISPRTADDRLRRATRWMARGVVKGHPFGKLEFRDITPATFEPPCIVISNHQSAVDVMLVVSLPGDVRQTAKKRVFDTPILGIGCKLLGHVRVEPNDPETTLRRCREKFQEGACVHFYPEGTRSFDGWVKRFHLGAFELAIETNREILPILLCDTNTAMPRDAYWFEPYHAVVRALPRVTPQNFDYTRGAAALARHCERLVREALQKQADELNTTRVVRRKAGRLYRYQGKFIEQFVYWKLRVDPMFEVLDDAAPRSGFMLDLGCGYGLATHWLSQYTEGRTFLGVDYDEEKIRVAQLTAPDHPRIRFEPRDILDWDYPPCDAALLLDVLHYWRPEKQRQILGKVRRALRPGGRLLLRDAARAESAGHRHVAWWETLATRAGHNRTREGLHFQTLAWMEDALRGAGFARWEVIPGGGRDSNVLLRAQV
jgi:1-acyl-sn-glycerol-3-phosphate acyltransferase